MAVYTIKKQRLVRQPDGKSWFLQALDGAEDDSTWDRLIIDYEWTGRADVKISVVSMNQKEIRWKDTVVDLDDLLCGGTLSTEEKLKFMQAAGGFQEENKKDILLYRLRGRYLWIAISMEGEGEGWVNGMKVYQKEDDFLDTFPEIYRERNSFFHRYLTIFSALYHEFQGDIDQFYKNFQPDTAPAEMLPVLAEWLGINLQGGFLKEDVMRKLAKNAYALNRIKGTKKAMEQVIRIVLGESPVILEKNKGESYERKKNTEESDITILIKTQVEQKEKAGLVFLLEQFKPFGCTMRLIFLKHGGRMDGHTYLDMNAMIEDGTVGYLDMERPGQNIILK